MEKKEMEEKLKVFVSTIKSSFANKDELEKWQKQGINVSSTEDGKDPKCAVSAQIALYAACGISVTARGTSSPTAESKKDFVVNPDEGFMVYVNLDVLHSFVAIKRDNQMYVIHSWTGKEKPDYKMDPMWYRSDKFTVKPGQPITFDVKDQKGILGKRIIKAPAAFNTIEAEIKDHL
jgi:hypothetical protein